MKAAPFASCVALLLSGCVEMPTQWPQPAAPAPTVAVPTPMAPSPAYVPAPPPAYAPAPEPPVPPPPPVVTDRDIAALYENLLGRHPSHEEVREWRQRLRRLPMGPDEVAASLRQTDEFRRHTVRRAYRELLEREPDQPGFDRYVRLMAQGTPEADLFSRIRQSEEYRVTLPDSKTRRAYREVLGRDADEGGLQHYRKLIVDKGWTEDDVKNDLRKSAEYRNRSH